MPGDICFNCGRLSTLLVTPRPPRNSIENPPQATAGPAVSQERPVVRSNAFDSQYDRLETRLAAKESAAKSGDQHHAFGSQLSEIEALLDARKKLARIHTLAAANDTAMLDHTAARSSYTRFTYSPSRFSNSSEARSTRFSGSGSKTLRSDSVALSDTLSEDGRPHAHIAARWLEDARPSGRSSAQLTRRGVDCRLNLAGRNCEWVIFL
ncbi:MAG: hypothetical protein ALECFALPRED_006379 [Alectoria fallacina]|uniref:Uncharacterized protein n=1 Tax=Alectoria fallacina TaxID=1903189 RepID=A0A8H3IVI7_9LECA|nr:MAG: hypothetical protein ALECFALPRED_006379 [Alectoria fallacina]